MRNFGFAVALLGLLSISAAGQEVTIKVAKPAAGDRIKVTKNEKMKAAVSFSFNGKSDSKDEVETKTIVYVDEVITPADGPGKPIKLKRTYEKYDVSKGGKDAAAPPLNTAILIEKIEGKYAFSADGKQLEGPVATQLATEFDRNAGGPQVEQLLPGKPVKAGDTWKVDLTKLTALTANAGGMVLDNDASELTGKLVKTYQKDGKQFGVMEFTGQLVVKSLGEKSPVKLKAGSKMGLKMTADACIDGKDPTSSVNGVLTIKMEGEGGGITLSITADGTMSSVEELLPKAKRKD